MMDIGTLAQWAGFFVSFAALAYAVVGNKSKAANTRAAGLEKRADELENRMTKVESALAHLPDKDVTHRLELSLSEMRTEISVLAERIKPVSAISVRLQEVLLEKAGGR
jgi:uncharacterized coiled-coil protein SlyX